MRKPIHCSNLAMRFYKGDGWTKDELDRCCVRGEVVCRFPDDKSPYFTLDHEKGSYFDCRKLQEVGFIASTVHTSYGHLSELQYMEKMQ